MFTIYNEKTEDERNLVFKSSNEDEDYIKAFISEINDILDRDLDGLKDINWGSVPSDK